MAMNLDAAAENFLTMGIQEWGQSDEKRASATADYLRAAGFSVKDSGFPVFGRLISKHGIDGPDGEEAKAWLSSVLKAMPRGKFESEHAHLLSALQQRLPNPPTET